MAGRASTLACARAQLGRDAAPFDPKPMPLLDGYDSIENNRFHELLGLQISQRPPGAGVADDFARSCVNGPPRDGAYYPDPPVQSILYVLQ
jgi:hypothetical protein